MKKAVVIGANSKGDAKLDSAEKYAKAIAKTLEESGYELLKFIGDYISAKEIRDMIEDFAKDSKKNSTFLFYFVGHGLAVSDTLLLALNSTDFGDYGTALNFKAVQLSLEPINCKAINKLIVLDCCNAKKASKIINFQNSKNYYVITAADIFGSEIPDLNNGEPAPFVSYYILKALSGEATGIKDNKITPNSLKTYLQEERRNYIRKYPDINLADINIFGGDKNEFEIINIEPTIQQKIVRYENKKKELEKKYFSCFQKSNDVTLSLEEIENNKKKAQRLKQRIESIIKEIKSLKGEDNENKSDKTEQNLEKELKQFVNTLPDRLKIFWNNTKTIDDIQEICESNKITKLIEIENKLLFTKSQFKKFITNEIDFKINTFEEYLKTRIESWWNGIDNIWFTIFENNHNTFVRKRNSDIFFIKRLDCAESYISDLSVLSEFSELEILICKNTNIESVEQILNMNMLQILDLTKTKINTILPLLKLPHLKFLGICETIISDDEIKQFQKNKPNCEVIFYL